MRRFIVWLFFIFCVSPVLVLAILGAKDMYNASKVEIGCCYFIDGARTDEMRENPFKFTPDMPEYTEVICTTEKRGKWIKYDYYIWHTDKGWAFMYDSESEKGSYPFTNVAGEVRRKDIVWEE